MHKFIRYTILFVFILFVSFLCLSYSISFAGVLTNEITPLSGDTVTINGDVVADNLSGTNTGDQDESDILPDQSGNSGKFLTTDGSNSSWGDAGGGGDVSKVGTPVDNEVGVWTGDGTLEGDDEFQFTGTDLSLYETNDVADGTDGSSLTVHRKASEGDSLIKFLVEDNEQAWFEINADAGLRMQIENNAGSALSYIDFNSSTDINLFSQGDNAMSIYGRLNRVDIGLASWDIYIEGALDVTDEIVAGSGNIQITDATGNIDGTKVADADLGDIGVSSGVWAVEDDSHAHTASTVSGLSDADFTDFESDVAGTSAVTDNTAKVTESSTAGRSLTLSTYEIDADAELYTGQAGRIAFENPTADDDFFFNEINVNQTAVSIYCKTLVGTVDLDVTIGGSDINGSDITCTTDGVLDDSLAGDTDLDVGEELKLEITSVSSPEPTYLMVIVNSTKDD